MHENKKERILSFSKIHTLVEKSHMIVSGLKFIPIQMKSYWLASLY